MAGKIISVGASVTLTVPPPNVISFTNEPITLSADKPAGWAKGSRLKGANARDVNAFGAFVPGSLTIRRTLNGETLKENEDYLLDAGWGHVGIGTNSHVTTKDTVYASYSCSLSRVDTVEISGTGKVTLKTGTPHISAPVPPPVDAGSLALANIYTPNGATTIKPDQIYPILETPAQAITHSTPGRIPRTLAKLKAGEPVKIVCWGDSVTAGGNASKPETRYVDVFAAGLRERFPKSKIDVENVSVGGSNSKQWLHPDKYRFGNQPPETTPTKFQRVIDAKPDLVTIEFVNDAGLKGEALEAAYNEILQQMQVLHAEVILITPHYTMWKMMGFDNMRDVEKRPYVLDLRKFADAHQIALADASARWEHLWKEGLPYLTLLHNTINHPDDRGHRLFAEELWKCFE